MHEPPINSPEPKPLTGWVTLHGSWTVADWPICSHDKCNSEADMEDVAKREVGELIDANTGVDSMECVIERCDVQCNQDPAED